MPALSKFPSQSIYELLAVAIRFIPGPLGIRLRYQFYKRRVGYLGKSVVIDEGVYILNPKNVHIGDDTWIDKNVILIAGEPSKGERVFIKKENLSYEGQSGQLYIGQCCHLAPNVVVQAHGGVQIGNYITLASGAKVYSMSHHYTDGAFQEDSPIYKFSTKAPGNEQCLIVGPVVLQDNTALGLNSIVLPGVTIGRNSWVGASSCVVNDIPSNVIAVGSPARAIKNRFD